MVAVDTSCDDSHLLGLALLGLARWRLSLAWARFSLSSLDELPTALEAALIATGLLVARNPPGCGHGKQAPSGLRLLCAVVGLARVPAYVMVRSLRRNDVARERLLW